MDVLNIIIFFVMIIFIAQFLQTTYFPNLAASGASTEFILLVMLVVLLTLFFPIEKILKEEK